MRTPLQMELYVKAGGTKKLPLFTFQVKIWFQNRRMKWKRSKKAQQEARAKNSGLEGGKRGRAEAGEGSKLNNNNDSNFETGKTSEMDDDDDIDDGDIDVDDDAEDDEEEIDVSGEADAGVGHHLLPHGGAAGGGQTPIQLLREALPGLEHHHHGNTSLSSILPPHLARMTSGPNSRFYRPFVA